MSFHGFMHVRGASQPIVDPSVYIYLASIQAALTQPNPTPIAQWAQAIRLRHEDKRVGIFTRQHPSPPSPVGRDLVDPWTDVSLS